MKTLKELGHLALNEVLYAYEEYPARTISLVAAAVVYIAARNGFVLDEQSVAGALKDAAPLLLSGHLIHRRVRPV